VQRLRDQLAVPQLPVRVLGLDLDHDRYVSARLVLVVAAAADRDKGPVGVRRVDECAHGRSPLPRRGTRQRGTPRREVSDLQEDVHAVLRHGGPIQSEAVP
jgi:hypothetical protein